MSEEESIIYSYSRAEALEDGVLVDVTEHARALGIKYPVAVTDALWKIASHCPDSSQSLEGRLWDTLWMFRLAALKQGGQEVHFSVLYRMDVGTEEVKIWALCGPGDTEEPAITIMLEGED